MGNNVLALVSQRVSPRYDLIRVRTISNMERPQQRRSLVSRSPSALMSDCCNSRTTQVYSQSMLQMASTQCAYILYCNTDNVIHIIILTEETSAQNSNSTTTHNVKSVLIHAFRLLGQGTHLWRAELADDRYDLQGGVFCLQPLHHHLQLLFPLLLIIAL